MSFQHFDSCKESLPVIREYVRRQISGLDDILSNQIILAVDEVCANSILHGRGRRAPFQLNIRIIREAAEVVVEIEDSAEAFPVHLQIRISPEEKIRNRQKGGLGLALVQRIMDQIEIVQVSDHHIIRLIKHL